MLVSVLKNRDFHEISENCKERRMIIIIGVLLLAILLSFGRISSGWKKGFDFFYSSPKEEVNKDARLNQGLGGENVDASSESVEK